MSLSAPGHAASVFPSPHTRVWVIPAFCFSDVPGKYNHFKDSEHIYTPSPSRPCQLTKPEPLFPGLLLLGGCIQCSIEGPVILAETSGPPISAFLFLRPRGSRGQHTVFAHLGMGAPRPPPSAHGHSLSQATSWITAVAASEPVTSLTPPGM